MMKGFKRWTVGVVAKFDDLLGQVENHEALANQALRDMRTSLARANGQLARVDRDCRNLEQEVRTTHATATKWRERAQKESNDQRAMECLRRAREKKQAAERLAARLTDQKRMRDQVAGTVKSLEQKFLELNGQKRLLVTRQAAAQASEAVSAESENSLDVEDVFSRWDIKLTEREFQPGVDHEIYDELSETYSEQEEEESLANELRELRQQAIAEDHLTDHPEEGAAS